MHFSNLPRIDSNTAIVAFVDDSTGGGITLVIVEATQNDRVPVRFGSRFSVSTGNSQIPKYNEYTYQGTVYVDYLSMDFSVTPLGSVEDSSNPGVAVMYADITNEAKWTLAMVEITSDYEIVRSSPHFVVNKGSTLGIDSDNYGLTFETVMSAASSSRVGLFTTISSGDCNQFAISDLSLIEVKASARGIVTDASSTSAQVQLSGVVSGFSGLVPGASYYSDTRGNLVMNSLPSGRTSTYSSLYDYIETGSSMITLDSKVGVAISDTSLALSIH